MKVSTQHVLGVILVILIAINVFYFEDYDVKLAAVQVDADGNPINPGDAKPHPRTPPTPPKDPKDSNEDTDDPVDPNQISDSDSEDPPADEKEEKNTDPENEFDDDSDDSGTSMPSDTNKEDSKTDGETKEDSSDNKDTPTVSDEPHTQLPAIPASDKDSEPGFYVNKPAWVNDPQAQNAQNGQCGGTMGVVNDLKNRQLSNGETRPVNDWWPISSFSPPTTIVDKEPTDLKKAFTTQGTKETFDALYGGGPENEIDQHKKQLNELGLVLNWDKFTPEDDHVPIWMRVFSRTTPLDNVLNGLRNVKDIEKTVLFITIDGTHKNVLEYIIQHADFTRIRIFFHAFTTDVEMFDMASMGGSLPRVNTHFNYGLRMMYDIFKYDYVSILEDDIQPGPDFYLWHKDMRVMTRIDQRVFSIGSIMHGPIHDCNYIASKLKNQGICRISDTNTIIAEHYYTGWGAGLPRRTFFEYLPFWKQNIYDLILSTLIKDRVTLAPCSHRAKWQPNSGVHGGAGSPRWDHPLPMIHAAQHDLYAVDNKPYPDMIMLDMEKLRDRAAHHKIDNGDN